MPQTVQPVEFFFELHSMPGLPSTVEWVNGRLEIRSDYHPNPFFRSPTPEAWDDFWIEVDELGVWEWESSYHDPGVLDGIGWGLRFGRDGRRIVSRGSNAYPGQTKRFGGPTTDFRRLTRAVTCLVGNTYLFVV